MKIQEKDWERMSDLVLSGKDGGGTASIMKNKNKAIARFICGVKLYGSKIKFNTTYNDYTYTHFNEFAKKAIELGATPEEIQKAFDETIVPTKYLDNIKNLSSKKLDNPFVGDIIKKILDAGFEINHLPHNGYALTDLGREAMERNGCKWTIGYKMELTKDDKKIKFYFDAITDEGDGPCSYVFDTDNSSQEFDDHLSWEKLGKLKFISKIKDVLSIETAI